MSNYVQEHLMPGETAVYTTRLHWIVFAPTITLFTFVVLISLGYGIGAFIFWLIIAAIAVGLIYMKRTNSEFGITNKRVLIKTGVLHIRSLETLLPKVEGIHVDQNILGQMLGYGTIVINGVGGTKEAFPQIENPLEFRKQVHEQISQLK